MRTEQAEKKHVVSGGSLVTQGNWGSAFAIIEQNLVIAPSSIEKLATQIQYISESSSASFRNDHITLKLFGYGLGSEIRVLSLSIDDQKSQIAPTGTLKNEQMRLGSVKLLETFNTLRDSWKAKTLNMSSLTQIVMDDSYQRIIGLGPSVVPLILEELKKAPDLWFWALRSITRDDPVKSESTGKIRRMAEDWLFWGRAQGLIG